MWTVQIPPKKQEVIRATLSNSRLTKLMDKFWDCLDLEVLQHDEQRLIEFQRYFQQRLFINMLSFKNVFIIARVACPHVLVNFVDHLHMCFPRWSFHMSCGGNDKGTFLNIVCERREWQAHFVNRKGSGYPLEHDGTSSEAPIQLIFECDVVLSPIIYWLSQWKTGWKTDVVNLFPVSESLTSNQEWSANFLNGCHSHIPNAAIFRTRLVVYPADQSYRSWYYARCKLNFYSRSWSMVLWCQPWVLEKRCLYVVFCLFSRRQRLTRKRKVRLLSYHLNRWRNPCLEGVGNFGGERDQLNVHFWIDGDFKGCEVRWKRRVSVMDSVQMSILTAYMPWRFLRLTDHHKSREFKKSMVTACKI